MARKAIRKPKDKTEVIQPAAVVDPVVDDVVEVQTEMFDDAEVASVAPVSHETVESRMISLYGKDAVKAAPVKIENPEDRMVSTVAKQPTLAELNRKTHEVDAARKAEMDEVHGYARQAVDYAFGKRKRRTPV